MKDNNENKTLTSTKASNKTTDNLFWWENVVSGAVSGLVTRFFISPLDVVKIRLQVQGAGPPKYQNTLHAFKLILAEEGIRGLWKGNLSAEYMYLLYGSIQFYSYERSKAFLKVSEMTFKINHFTIIDDRIKICLVYQIRPFQGLLQHHWEPSLRTHWIYFEPDLPLFSRIRLNYIDIRPFGAALKESIRTRVFCLFTGV